MNCSFCICISLVTVIGRRCNFQEISSILVRNFVTCLRCYTFVSPNCAVLRVIALKFPTLLILCIFKRLSLVTVIGGICNPEEISSILVGNFVICLRCYTFVAPNCAVLRVIAMKIPTLLIPCIFRRRI